MALQWAIQAPGTISQLAVGSPTIAGVPTEADAEKRYKELMMLRRFAGPGEQMAGLWMSSPPDIFKGLEQHPQAWAHMRSVVVAHQWAELANGVMGRLTSHVHTDEDLRRITARTLAVVGDEDMPTFLDNAKRLHDVVPDCELTTVTAAGHLVLIEQPSDVAPDLAAFLA
jgi:pimeloyl-ACP methyl ester carboxylesterase